MKYNYLEWWGDVHLSRLIKEKAYPFVVCFYEMDEPKEYKGYIDILNDFCKEYYETTFLMIEGGKYENIVKKYNIEKIPTILVFKGGGKRNIHYFTDKVTVSELGDFFKNHLTFLV